MLSLVLPEVLQRCPASVFCEAFGCPGSQAQRTADTKGSCLCVSALALSSSLLVSSKTFSIFSVLSQYQYHGNQGGRSCLQCFLKNCIIKQLSPFSETTVSNRLFYFSFCPLETLCEQITQISFAVKCATWPFVSGLCSMLNKRTICHGPLIILIFKPIVGISS